MKNHAAAAASTLMTLISTAESFISTPGSTTSNGCGNRVTSTASVGKAPSACLPTWSLVSCSRVGGLRRRRGTQEITLHAKGRGAPGAGAATEKRRQQQPAAGGKPSSAESAIDGKRQGEVEELKKKLQRELAVGFLFL